MKQYSICQLRGGNLDELVVVLQSDLIDEQQTQIVAPLVPVGLFPRLIRLNPIISLQNTDYMIVIDQMLSIPSRMIEKQVGTAIAKQDEISSALDYILKGF